MLESEEWLPHDGGQCPCVGIRVEVIYTDGEMEEEFGGDVLDWKHVVKYKLCKSCAERRAKLTEALSQKDAIKAAKHAMAGVAEMVGIKKKESGDD